MKKILIVFLIFAMFIIVGCESDDESHELSTIKEAMTEINSGTLGLHSSMENKVVFYNSDGFQRFIFDLEDVTLEYGSDVNRFVIEGESITIYLENEEIKKDYLSFY